MTQTYMLDFKKQQAVEALSEQVVTLAEEAMTPKVVKARQMNTQLSNFLNVAQTTSSVRVVVNWIRYQMNRNDTRQQWSDTGLGKKAITDIATLEKSARSIAGDLDAEQPTRHLADVHMRLIAQYAGYLKRSYVANGGRG